MTREKLTFGPECYETGNSQAERQAFSYCSSAGIFLGLIFM